MSIFYVSSTSRSLKFGRLTDRPPKSKVTFKTQTSFSRGGGAKQRWKIQCLTYTIEHIRCIFNKNRCLDSLEGAGMILKP